MNERICVSCSIEIDARPGLAQEIRYNGSSIGYGCSECVAMDPFSLLNVFVVRGETVKPRNWEGVTWLVIRPSV